MDKLPTPPTLLVIIGISGDLSTRKLLPAIEKIATAQAVNEPFQIMGISRQPLTVQDILKKLPTGQNYSYLHSHTTMHHMDMTSATDYTKLKAIIETFSNQHKNSQTLFYLSIPPQVSQPIIELLGKAGIASIPRTKLLLEKPFGTDLVSAQDLILQTKKYFKEEQLYRIDHYLAKEMAQNLIVFREGNSLFRKTWNKDFIEKIIITASEKIGIEGRTQFYEQTGALRDLVQSHLLQLLALTTMQTPQIGHFEDVPAARLEALKNLRIANTQNTLRGQYEGYKDEVGLQHSSTETLVRLELVSSDPVWEGVPFIVQTGKALAEKRTDIRIVYKKDSDLASNELVITLQPNEGINLHMWAKVPAYEWKIEKHSLKLGFREAYGDLPEAYEQVFLDAINSKHTLFTTSAEVEASWQILAAVQEHWALLAHKGLVIYKQGTSIDEIA